MYRIETKKDKVKLFRSILQLAVLITLLVLVLRALFTFIEYVPYDPADKAVVSGEDHGFVALSYIGVDRESKASRIDEEKLKEHLQALYNNGYVTITQEDIENYYNNGTPLPDKALFLMFEDGRNDTAIYAQSVMEKFNYKGTMFTYAEKFRSEDSMFLMPNDLKELKESGFWEIGSNGYRLAYINVFDRYNRFIGELSSTEYTEMAPYFGRDYNQYLMDYIRDRNDLPVESYSQMRARILGEYDLMEEEYLQGLGEMPKAYTLMHANTGAFGTNDKVSAVNEECIKRLFHMNFNREGYSYNTADVDIYDLTRMQPQSTWYTNHLLMRIKDDLPEEDQDSIQFVTGDVQGQEKWSLEKGAVEYKDELIALTSESDGSGILRLNSDEAQTDVAFSCILKGNVLGYQAVHLRSNEDLTQEVSVVLWDNMLLLTQNGEVLEVVDLYEIDEIPPVSVEEDKRDSMAGEYAAFAHNATSVAASREYKELQDQVESTEVDSVADGAEEYRPAIDINELGERKLEISLVGDHIDVKLDDKEVWTDYKLDHTEAGSICLESACKEYGYSQRNILDDVYDGVFERIEIKDMRSGSVVYSNLSTGVDQVWYQIKIVWDKVINWFIENL